MEVEVAVSWRPLWGRTSSHHARLSRERQGGWGQYVDPDHCQVSPIFDDDVNELNPGRRLDDNGIEIDDDPIPAVNALGERRGLLAFKVTGYL